MTTSLAPQPPLQSGPPPEHGRRREVPLYLEEAEQCVLGAMLLDASATLKAAGMLTPSCFVREAHRLLFSTMMALTQRGVAIDHITLRDELTRNGQLEHAGGLEYLAELVDAVPTSANVEWHAGIVRELARRRELVTQAQAAITLAYDRTQNIEQSVSRTVDRLVQITQPTSDGPQKEMHAELWEALGDVERQAQLGDVVTGISSGIPRLDDMTDGWVPGRLIVVAARPKVGKTAVALHFTREACKAEPRAPVYFATAEQPRKELLKRLLGIESGWPLRGITSPQMLEMSQRGLAAAAGEVSSWPLVVDQVSRTPGQVRMGLQRHIAEKGPVGLVVADYLGKYHSGEKSERHDLEIARITGAFGELAIDVNVPVILLVQLNRQSVQGGQVRRPTPSDLRDSGAIEQDAAQVVFLYRDEKSEEAAKDPGWLQMFLDLNRFGPTGVVDVHFEKTTGRWRRYQPTNGKGSHRGS